MESIHNAQREPDETDVIPELRQFVRERDALLARIIQVLRDDTRVAAAWLSGSFGRGEADEWSDFDLHVAVTDAHYAQYLDERPALYAHAGQPVLVQADMASNSMPGGRYQLVLYSGCHHVDWNIGPLGAARRPVASRMLLERVEVPIGTQCPLSLEERRAEAEKWLTFFWAMAPIAIKYAARAETRLAVSQIDLLTRAVIALWRLAADPHGPNPWLPSTNRVLEPELDARLPRVGASIDPWSALGVIRALCVEVEALHPALGGFVPIPTSMPLEIRQLSDLAERVIHRGGQRRRTYR